MDDDKQLEIVIRGNFLKKEKRKKGKGIEWRWRRSKWVIKKRETEKETCKRRPLKSLLLLRLEKKSATIQMSDTQES